MAQHLCSGPSDGLGTMRTVRIKQCVLKRNENDYQTAGAAGHHHAGLVPGSCGNGSSLSSGEIRH